MVKPSVSVDDIKNIVYESYGLSVTKVKGLDGYDDANFFINVAKESNNENIPIPAADGYVLKISNGKFTPQAELMRVQNDLMKFLSGRLGDVSVPVPQYTLESGTLAYVDLPRNSATVTVKHIVRLFSFTPGSIMSSVKSEPTPETLIDIGIMTGRLVTAFSEYDQGGQTADCFTKGSSMLWSLEGICAGYLDSLLTAVDNPLQLATYRKVIHKMQRRMLEFLPVLKRGIIHGDINEGNVILNESTGVDNKYVLNGLIDFGDLHHSCQIFEPVLAMMYMMLECYEKGTVDPIDAGGYVLAGYLSMHSLSAAESQMLKIGIEARCVQSLIIGLYTFKFEQPGNMYVLNTQKKGWAILETLHNMSENELFERWDKILLKTIGKVFFNNNYNGQLTTSSNGIN